MVQAAKEITHPVQLLALGVISLLVISIMVITQTLSLTNAMLLAGSIIAISFLASIHSIVRPKTKIEVSERPKEALQGTSPESIPQDLKLQDDLYRRLQGPFEELGFRLQHSVDSSRWGRTYYYSYAENKAGRRMALLTLDGSYFVSGARWMEIRWLGLILQILREVPTDLVIFSNTGLVCEEALYEIQDVRRMYKVNTKLITKLALTTFRSAATSEGDIAEALRVQLEI